jgi:hypothetical protein
VEPELAPVPLRLGRSALRERLELLRLHVPQDLYVLFTSRDDTSRSIPACCSPQDRKRRGVVLWSRKRSQTRDEQRHVFERRLIVLFEPKAKPPGGEAAVAMRLFPRHKRCQLERLGDRHAADLPRGYLGEYEVAAFQRPPLAMIDATYGHLALDADERERALLDAYDLGAAAERATAR